MIERLIESNEYTQQILEQIEIIKSRMRNTLTDFTDDQIAVFDVDGVFYILANPPLGEEPIFDRFGNFVKMVPMYNITIMNDKDWISFNQEGMSVKQPRLRILRPDLCARI